jgi:hypothetical protein
MINIDLAKGAHIDLGQAGELPIQSQTRTLLERAPETTGMSCLGSCAPMRRHANPIHVVL